MDLDHESATARGLRRYVGLVADAVGVSAAAAAVQLDDPVNVYLPLQRCVDGYPDHDLALLWDERCGWLLAVEVPGTVRLTLLGYLAGTLLPAPHVVADYVTRAGAGRGFGAALPQRATDEADLAGRLAAYADHRQRSAWSWIGHHSPRRPHATAAPGDVRGRR